MIEMKPLIFHCDCNNFYASCECLERPELKNVPMAVAGDPGGRRGVVVAKNELAKKAGVKTTDTVWLAKKKCPGIVFVPPRHSYYEHISKQVNEIYREFTEYVEPASIDESYLDMTEVTSFLGVSPIELADMLRARIREEIGITISIGVSYNKPFAKMGSDYKKPDATTLITPENYKDILWQLPVSELLFVGKATRELLQKHYINTIGELASCPIDELRSLLGKAGEQLWTYANGLDTEPVRLFTDQGEIKSISRGMTFRRDLITEAEIRTALSKLSDEVAMQLRRHELKGSVVYVQIKKPDFVSFSRQTTLEHPTHLQREIFDTTFQLVRNNWCIGQFSPIRAMTVGVSHLVGADEIVEQISMFDAGLLENKENHFDRAKQERIEEAVASIREKHGNHAIAVGITHNEVIK